MHDKTTEPAAWLIWSGEHKAWWRENARGYSLQVGGAGRYTRSGADAYVRASGPEKMLDIVPDPYGPFAESGSIRMASENTTACIGNDPYCPCQDGFACHYVDLPGSPAMKPKERAKDEQTDRRD